MIAMNKKIFILVICALVWPIFFAQDEPGAIEKEVRARRSLNTRDEITEAQVDKELNDDQAADGGGRDDSEAVIPSPAQSVRANKQAPDFDEAAKKKEVIDLVDQGIEFFKNNTMDVVGRVFTHTKEFVRGELYLFVLDINGNVYAQGQESTLLWQNLYNFRDSLGVLAIQEMIKKAKDGGGWVTYEWRNASKLSYVKLVDKDGKSYVIGSGYYPHSKEDAVIRLVKSAVHLCDELKKDKHLIAEAFGEINYPLGRFIDGDLYLYSLDFKGNVMAQGDRPGLVGTNSWTYKDERGKLINQEIVHKLEQTNDGIWIEYLSKNAVKKTYAEKVQDSQGNFYFIACGYYPEAGRDAAVDLVRKGYQYVKGQGKSVAAREFTDKHIMTYRYGDLYLVMYDMKGLCVAHGDNDEMVGKNMFDTPDMDGRLYVRELIAKAQDGGGWVDVKLNNSFQSIYVEKLDLGIESFVISCGVYPVSKRETMMLVTKGAAGYLKTHERPQALADFTKVSGKFIRGDLEIFVFDTKGVCYAYGDDTMLIWQNLFDLKDDDGRQFIKVFINSVQQGPTFIRFKLNGKPALAYVELLDKDGVSYVIGSSFYL